MDFRPATVAVWMAGFTQGLRRGVVSKLEALLKEHFPVDLLDRRPQVAGFFPGHHVQSPLLHLRRFFRHPGDVAGPHQPLL